MFSYRHEPTRRTFGRILYVATNAGTTVAIPPPQRGWVYISLTDPGRRYYDVNVLETPEKKEKKNGETKWGEKKSRALFLLLTWKYLASIAKETMKRKGRGVLGSLSSLILSVLYLTITMYCVVGVVQGVLL